MKVEKKNYKYLNTYSSLFLITTVIVAWLYTIFGIGMNMSAWKMTLMEYNHIFSSEVSFKMDNMSANTNIFSTQYFISLFFMWAFMMIAMMLPSAIPIFSMYDKIYTERINKNYKLLKPISFICVYIFVWIIFSLIATLLQIILLNVNNFNALNFKSSKTISSIIFIFAGIYQFSPLKNFCLYYCQNPIEILSKINFNNFKSQLKVSLKHAIFCLGCCWALMLILFSVGVMNLLWISIISIYVFVEKNIVKTKYLDNLTGVILITLGITTYFK